MKSLNCGVVGFIGEFNNLEFKKNDAEVEKIFTVPIEVLIDQTVFRKTYFRNSSEFSFEWPLENSRHGFLKKFNFRSRHNQKYKKKPSRIFFKKFRWIMQKILILQKFSILNFLILNTIQFYM